MNRNKLKQYAPQARRDFIAAVADRAAYYGLTNQKDEPISEQGDVVLISGQPFPRSMAAKRKRLEERITQQGFEQVMEAMAYTWFNRLVAIRYMELHGYLEHGYRVLSHPEGKPIPEILEHAEHVNLLRLDTQKVIELKLDGSREAELYRMLLMAQCNALHSAMPFLFERIDDETELLFPDNLLHSDSLIRKLVNSIDEEDWQEVEIIGWLYQFYIAEKKDQVIGKVVKSEDIPAATQLFTPNWIVKYLVQNSLGQQWLGTYPDSPLRQQMDYYIEPAEQTPEVQGQLKAITPTSLNPEDLTLLDPACGSGHILVEAYDLFKAIYQERGYRSKDIPALILQKNLFGLEIDDRAAQLAAFALMMKARADDRRLFDSKAKPNILAFQDSQGLNAADITYALNAPINKEDVSSEYLFEEIEEEKAGLFSKKALAEKGHVLQGNIASLLELFENAKTFGSLIQIPPKLAANLPDIEKRLDDVLRYGDLTHASAKVIKPLLQQARLLARQYDAVVANPPYMGSRRGMNAALKKFAEEHFPDSKHDLFAVFTERLLKLVPQTGLIGLMTPFTWMFIRSYEPLRRKLLEQHAISSLIQPEYHSFFDSAFVPICAFVISELHTDFRGSYIRLTDFYGEAMQPLKALEAINSRTCNWRYEATTKQLQMLPGCPVVYWISDRLRHFFADRPSLETLASSRQGLATSDNERFVRYWWEVSISEISYSSTDLDDAARSGRKWFAFNKGGAFRRWSGNYEFIINWENSGQELLSYAASLYGSPTRTIKNQQYYFKPCLSWSDITAAFNAFRYYPEGFVFDVCAPSAFTDGRCDRWLLLAYLNSSLVNELTRLLNPTMHFNVGDFRSLPAPPEVPTDEIASIARRATYLADADWNRAETAWKFSRLLLLEIRSAGPTMAVAYADCAAICSDAIMEMKRLEEANNHIFIEACGLQSEFQIEVNESQITLYRPDQEEDIKRLLSYAIGCTLGRYSLDEPGLIYAHGGNQGFDPSQYKTFRADDDGIIPQLETDWGIRDDATNRFVEFIGVAWPKEHLEENLKFIADSLGQNNGEQPRETIRRYLATGFYKHHLSMYKKRPIYWLFCSGKHRAFQCLVYLHRYNESTLSRMRIEYVIPLQGKISSRIGQLADDIAAASSTSHRKKLEKERDTLVKHQAELYTFDEKLRHYADQRISLDLDDGVKINYGKFGDLLAEVKAVTGGTMDAES